MIRTGAVKPLHGALPTIYLPAIHPRPARDFLSAAGVFAITYWLMRRFASESPMVLKAVVRSTWLAPGTPLSTSK
jgi:hypothetical protein